MRDHEALRKSVLVVAYNLQVGGIQKALVNMLAELAESDRYEVQVIHFGGGPLLAEIPKNVTVTSAGPAMDLLTTPLATVMASRNPAKVVARLLMLMIAAIFGGARVIDALSRRHAPLRSYDIAVSYFHDAPKGLFNRGTDEFVLRRVRASRKLAWLHTDPVEAGYNMPLLVQHYARFDSLVVVADACARRILDASPALYRKTVVVHNLLPVETIKCDAARGRPIEALRRPLLVTVARIDIASKGLDKLVPIVGHLRERNIPCTWLVLGDGPDLAALIRASERAGHADVLRFLGGTNNPYPYVEQADLFVLPSNYEGYPMVVGEALALGTPVLVTNYVAAREQISEGINGLIVEGSVDALTQGLVTILSSDWCWPSRSVISATFLARHSPADELSTLLAGDAG